MSRSITTVRFACCVALLLALAGCDDAPDRATKSDAKPKAIEGKKVRVGDNVYLEIVGTKRRVLLTAEDCLRKGPLEQLLTRKNKKEHEAILSADLDARKIHEALILANAKEGEPVRYAPKFRAPSGTAIKITLVYTDAKGVKKSVDARSWLKNAKSGKELDCDWVFAGSMLVENPLDKNAPKTYLANEGDVICVSNFDSALLDVPIKSSKDDSERGYEAWEDRIPPVGTEVTVILEPVVAEKAKKK